LIALLFYQYLLRTLRRHQDTKSYAKFGYRYHFIRFDCVTIMIYKERKTAHIVVTFCDDIAQKVVKIKTFRSNYYLKVLKLILKEVENVRSNAKK